MSLLSSMLILFVTCALISMAGITLLNMLIFPRLHRPPKPPAPHPRISLLIPARNEAAVISETVRHALNQQYPNMELLLLDDHSTDETAARARHAAPNDDRLRILSSKPLPPGWLGKNWACQQLSEAATGDILIFTDADVHWQPQALAALLHEMARTKADLLTVWPTQETVTWAERLTVPLMALVVWAYLPLLGVHHTPFAMFAAANGQCLAFRRQAYEALSGHQAVRQQVLEDVLLARQLKKQGFRLRMADGAGLIRCRMYRDWLTVRDGYAKNILAGYGGWVSSLLLATLFHWLIFLGPWLWLLSGDPAPYWPHGPLLLIALGLTLRALTAHTTRQRPLDALLMPLSVLLMTRIAAQAIWWHWRHGGPRWKGRLVK